MKVYIHGQGDTSVGIPDPSATVDLGDCDLDEYDKKFLRESLADTFAQFWDTGNTHVFFEDECPDCGKQMEENVVGEESLILRTVYECKNPQCISNQPEPEPEQER